MRDLKVDLSELTQAFRDATGQVDYYLDRETGQVMAVAADTRRRLARGAGEAGELDAGGPLGLPEWQQRELQLARRIAADDGGRYIDVPTADAGADYQDMEDFALLVGDVRLRERLAQALRGRGDFRRFRDALSGYPGEWERWIEFREKRLHRSALAWLESEGIRPIPASDRPERPADQGPSPRARLLAEVLAFVQAACRLPGVVRIALVGSLASAKPDPKDADLLVTVADDMDLAPLATLGRRIQGHAQAFNHGADVFLADPRGNYLGRTCPWRECAPGRRVRCDALHCGRRPYLHDDLEAVRLPKELIAAPPVELWPQIVASVPIPSDLEQAVLARLRQP